MNQSNSKNENESKLKVRGLMCGAVEGWTTDTFGEERYRSFLVTLPEEYVNLLENYEKKEWYPAIDVFLVYEHLIDFLADEMPEVELIEAIVNFMFSRAVTGFMKGLLSFLTPARLTKRATSFWLRVHSQGRVEYVHGDANHFNVVLHDWKVHRISCLIFTGWLKQLVRMTAVKDIEVKEINCALASNGPCEWKVTVNQ